MSLDDANKELKEKLSLLSKIEGFVKGVGEAQKLISSSLQLDRLERLAEKNSLVAVAYAQIIMHINYVLMTWDRDIHLAVGPVEIAGEKIEDILKFFFPHSLSEAELSKVQTFEPTIMGKFSAIGFCFAHDAGKLDNALSVSAFTEAMQGVGVIADIAKSLLGASRVGQVVYPGVPPGYEISPGYRLKKAKPGSNPGRPPKKWWDKKLKHIAQTDVYDPEAVLGDIWYNRLDDAKRSEILERYE